ncbi:hypothetical protein [Anabaena azotica]|nr:hypothetical protein [Anabaena azotica]
MSNLPPFIGGKRKSCFSTSRPVTNRGVKITNDFDLTPPPGAKLA